MKKNKEIFKIVGVFIFVLLSGMIVVAIHFSRTQIFSQGVTPLINQSIDIQRIKENIEEMSQAEIEETIKIIETEIEKLKTSI